VTRVIDPGGTTRRKLTMKTRLIAGALMLTALPLAAACSPASAEPADKDASIEVSADEFANTNNIVREVVVAEGGTLTVSLGSNPSTGFTWDEGAHIADPALLRQTASALVPAEGQGLVGAPGTQVWTFEALAQGTTTVSLQYSRPWEGGEKGVWTFDLTVTVK